MLVTELALALNDPREVAESYGLTREAFKALIENPVFVAAYKRRREQMMEEGMSLRAKAGMIAEDSLATLRAIFNNVENPISARLDAIKVIIDVAGASGKNKAAQANEGGNNFTINIDLSGGAPVVQSRRRGTLIEHDEA